MGFKTDADMRRAVIKDLNEFSEDPSVRYARYGIRQRAVGVDIYSISPVYTSAAFAFANNTRGNSIKFYNPTIKSEINRLGGEHLKAFVKEFG